MTTPSRRRFTLIDAALLIAASAGAMAIGRAAPPDLSWFAGAMRPGNLAYIAIAAAIQAVAPWLFTFTLATLVIDRSAVRAMRAGPPPSAGHAACLAAGVCSVALALKSAGLLVAFPPTRLATRGDLMSVDVGYVGFAVAGAWIILAWCGRWHNEPTWTDRLGRALGISWIAAACLDHARVFLLL